ncbi:metallophosphoesterase family protein [Candidatus Pacearchaeota archaeon]|jgi:DNA repair exonuclease SbcCD nuclease subunit|nr:metallophosphoesterase family protein [Candidatus Pacearchaeota archaeon]
MSKQLVAVIIGDIHFDLYAKFNKQLDNGKNSRAQLLINEVARIFDYAKENNIGNIIFLGDIFNSSEVVKTVLFNDVYDLFKNKPRNIDLHLFPGNHDYFSYFEDSVLHSFYNIPGIWLYENFHDCIIGGLKIAFHPYVSDGDSISNISREGDVIFIHQSVPGVVVGNYELIKAKDNIDPEKLFKKFKMIVSGHIHTKQICQDVIFPGSIAQKDFGDEGIKKYFSVLYDDLSIEYIPTQHPEFHTLDYIEKDDGEIEIVCEKGVQPTNIDESFVKVKASKELWKELSQTEYKDKNKNVVVDLKPDKKISAVRIQTEDLSDNKKVLENYLNFVSKNDEWVKQNKEKLLKKGLEYLE